MSDLSELYQEVILDHNRSPRNHGELPDPQRTAEGYNPLCGDKLQLGLKLDDAGRVSAIRFLGTGCAISQASASVMTTAVLGKTLDEVRELFSRFQDAVTGRGEADLEALGELAAVAGVKDWPTRVKCATLGWHAVLSALESGDRVSTE